MYQIDATFCDSSFSPGASISIKSETNPYLLFSTKTVSCSSSFVSQVALEADQAGATREEMVGIKGL